MLKYFLFLFYYFKISSIFFFRFFHIFSFTVKPLLFCSNECLNSILYFKYYFLVTQNYDTTKIPYLITDRLVLNLVDGLKQAFQRAVKSSFVVVKNDCKFTSLFAFAIYIFVLFFISLQIVGAYYSMQ